jgi:DNA ligase (NAD+)
MPSHAETLEYLGSLGLAGEPGDARRRRHRGRAQYIEHREQHRHDLPYEIDGVVVKIDSIERQRALGRLPTRRNGRSRSSSRPKERTTLLRDIQVSIGGKGKATPFAVLEPVFVGGSTVGVATLHNEDQVRPRTCGRATPSSCARPAT